MYYDLSKMMSYNALFNFVVGGRGVGKTYAFKKWSISDFIKNGNQFIYIRRFKSELKTIQTFFTDISHEFPEHDFKVKGGTFYIDDKAAGYYHALSTSKILKSTSYPHVSKIIFDEFILDKGVHHYLNDEVVYLLEFYETVARTRDNVRLFCLSNALSITNPYFEYFKISATKNSISDIKLIKKDLLVEIISNEEFANFKKQTRLGKLLDKTEYSDYAIDNKFFRDNDKFVEKRKGKTELKFNIKYKDKVYGVWSDLQGKYYISHSIDESFTTLAFTTDDHADNTILMKSNNFYVKMLKERFKYNMLNFESINIKNNILPLLEKMR